MDSRTSGASAAVLEDVQATEKENQVNGNDLSNEANLDFCLEKAPYSINDRGAIALGFQEAARRAEIKIAEAEKETKRIHEFYQGQNAVIERLKKELAELKGEKHEWRGAARTDDGCWPDCA